MFASIYIKASDTIPRADAQATRWWKVDRPDAKAAGMLVEGYQYVYPTNKPRDIIRDARRNARKASARVGRLRPGDLPLVLDLETAPKKLGPIRLTRWAVAWLNTAEAHTGRTPILYTYSIFAQTRLLPVGELTRFPLWQAEYGVNVSAPRKIAGWPDATPSIWQFSSNGRVAGCPRSLIDLNVFNGSAADLLALAGLPESAAPTYGLA